MMLGNKVAIVAGSDRGIVRGVVEMFVEHGAKVVISDINAKPANEVLEIIKSRGGEAITAIKGCNICYFR